MFNANAFPVILKSLLPCLCLRSNGKSDTVEVQGKLETLLMRLAPSWNNPSRRKKHQNYAAPFS
jgi:hypothetical protein